MSFTLIKDNLIKTFKEDDVRMIDFSRPTSRFLAYLPTPDEEAMGCLIVGGCVDNSQGDSRVKRIEEAFLQAIVAGPDWDAK